MFGALLGNGIEHDAVLVARIAQLEAALNRVAEVLRAQPGLGSADLGPLGVFETRRDYTGKVIHKGVGDPDPREYGNPAKDNGALPWRR